MKRKPSDYYLGKNLKNVYQRQVKDYPESEAHMNVALEMLKSYAQRVKPAFGTLLGLTRDKQLIPHDSDIDINLYADGEYPFLRGQIQMIFESQGYECVFRDTYQIVFSHPDSVMIDICYFQEQDDGRYRCDHQMKDFYISKEAVEDDELFLKEVYGDWKTPIPKNEKYLHGEGAK